MPASVCLRDMLRRPHLPADQLEAGRNTCLQELRAIDDEPSHKLMIELRQRPYPDPWGRSSHGEEAALRGGDDRRRPQVSRVGTIGRSNTILAVAGNFEWQRHVRRDRAAVRRLGSRWNVAEPDNCATGQPTGDHIPFQSNQSHVGIAYPTIPYKHPDYFQAWAAVGVLSSGSSSRLFTEVREKRGLCYTVYASLHTQRDRASVLCYAGTTAERAQETLDVTSTNLQKLGERDRAKRTRIG